MKEETPFDAVGPIAGTVEWLEALSAAQPSPAAGSAAALAGALGVALLIKLARLTRDTSAPDRDQLLARWIAARDRLTSLVDADASASEALIRTRRLGADDPARQAALQAAVDIPLEAAELCHTIALEAQPLLEGSRSEALPDGHVGIQLVKVCQRAMCRLARANLASWNDVELDTVRAGRVMERVCARPEGLSIDPYGDEDKEIG